MISVANISTFSIVQIQDVWILMGSMTLRLLCTTWGSHVLHKHLTTELYPLPAQENFWQSWGLNWGFVLARQVMPPAQDTQF
jgi:hypothetical protein